MAILNRPFMRPIFHAREIKPGMVVSFRYTFFGHDPKPIIIVAGMMPDGRITGLNLHYLPRLMILSLLSRWGGKPTFGYHGVIKNQRLLTNAYRTYKPMGMKDAKAVHWEAVQRSIKMQHRYAPEDIARMQADIQRQINPPQLPEKPEGE